MTIEDEKKIWQIVAHLCDNLRILIHNTGGDGTLSFRETNEDYHFCVDKLTELSDPDKEKP